MITVLVQPRTAIACSEQLKFLSEILNLRQIDIARVFNDELVLKRCVESDFFLFDAINRFSNVNTGFS